MEKKVFNLCTTYILPLLGLNKWSFGTTTDALVNSYVSEDDKYLVVELKVHVSSLVSNNPSFRFQFTKDKSNFVVFEIPAYFTADIKKFREGKYSEFSKSAKDIIKKKSGLSYMVPLAGGGKKSARELLVLDKDKELRETMEQELGSRIHPLAELASIPGEENFYDLKVTHKLEPTN